ncbi:MAG TPA: sigma-70 family RNA polymerase sigma factor [Lacunisphaera sp.]|jgi:RNA polymerase sigma factor (sigma-70 family)|nr:sigma-70 family RNA polymerase sigma factor [Lacunisphaera sp.]
MNTFLHSSPLDDVRLVERHLTGDPAAFRQIVERHQGMVCALAYSACGDLARSEDLAQEVFLAAWKQLAQLREPAKLRGWLAGIARNTIANSRRSAARMPTARAEPLSPETPADTATPREEAVHADEAALMWNALEHLPETYREPMVLFYREGRSAAAVAAALDISEETARQRLARGRTMLTERMAKLVEETLERSAPTPAFAGTVILSLPVLVPTVAETTLGASGAAAKSLASAGTIGSAVAKGGVVFKFLSAVALLPALLQGVEDYIKFSERNAAQPDEAARREAAKAYLLANAGIGLFIVGFMVVPSVAPLAHSWWAVVLVGLCAVAGIWMSFRAKCRVNRLQGVMPDGVVKHRGFEQRSATRLLGLPLYHIRLGSKPTGPAPVVKGWIAISDRRAVGGLFAFGPFAVAPVSMGIVGVGVISVSVAAIGAAALGFAAAGLWSQGLATFGLLAAKGIMPSAPFAAALSAKFAAGAGETAARAFCEAPWFYRFTKASAWVLLWAGLLGWVMPVVLTGWQLWRTRGTK